MPDQPLPQPGKTDVTEALIALLRERQQRGIETYGRTLETWNGRNSPRDALEEQIDSIQYTFQWCDERADLLAELDRLRPIAEAAREWRDANRAEGTGELEDEIALVNRQVAAEQALLAALGDE